MSFLNQANTKHNKDEFWSGQAIVETKFSVGDQSSARNTKVNAHRSKIGSKPASPATTGLQVNYLCLFHKSASTPSGTTPPVVFDSLTGMGWDPLKDNKYTVMARLSLAGRLQSSVNYEGTIPHVRDISVQCGGMCAIRLFTKTPNETVSWMDRLCWTIPDIGTAQEDQQYRHLTSLARQEFPVGKVPVLVEKMSPVLYQEFPRAAMLHFIKTIKSPDKFNYYTSGRAAKMGDPLDLYIISNFLAPAELSLGLFEFVGDLPNGIYKSAAEVQGRPAQNVTKHAYPEDLELGNRQGLFHKIQQEHERAAYLNFCMIYLNVGLVTWNEAKHAILEIERISKGSMCGPRAFIEKMDKRGVHGQNRIMNIANQQMVGQYDCFTYLRDHNFGKALGVGHAGDGLRILFRI
jgi:hypothetical protein